MEEEKEKLEDRYFKIQQENAYSELRKISLSRGTPEKCTVSEKNGKFANATTIVVVGNNVIQSTDKKSNKSAESERMLRKCILLDPRFTPAYMELAKLRGPNDQSVNQLLKQAVDMNPTDPYFTTNFGHWLIRKGNYREALWHYWRSLQISPTHQEAILGAAKLLQKFGQKARLFQLITRWQVIKRNGKSQLPLGLHLYLQGWHLKGELSHRARIYDVNRPTNTTKDAHLNRTASPRSSVPKTNNPNKSVGNNRSSSEAPNTDSLRPLMVHHFSDSV
ncbi:unnamed protein product [Diabrotica balteata]|uniref:Uncharacterized protein n=1 Tax=Diabrotica balteata TaxID=107213 RepID=A0A9N9SSN1_DIABA|nr:unnamed protein product [Diabrotica balteata]